METDDFGYYAVKDKVHRSEEHTSELQSLRHLVCRLLLEKKKDKTDTQSIRYSVSTRRMTPLQCRGYGVWRCSETGCSTCTWRAHETCQECMTWNGCRAGT